MAAPRKRRTATDVTPAKPARPRKPRAKQSPPRAARPRKPAEGPSGGFLFAVVAVTIAAVIFPLLGEVFLGPLAIWGGALLVAWWWSRPAVFAGDRALVALTFLILGLGLVIQTRLGTAAETWTLRANLPLVAGLVGYLVCLRWLTPELLARLLPSARWLLWLVGVGVIGVLFLFGRPYRGGLFLPGQINPTEFTKLALVAFAAAWMPLRAEGLGRTLCGVPFPPLRDALMLGFVWGVPLVGAVLVRDLGLALILCLTACFMLTALTRRPAWLICGLAAAVLGAWALHGLSAHTAARFAVWLDPFSDPLNKGWQIAQSLCAQYAGGLWGTGLGEGAPTAVPIVANDFVYAALAEEWGLIGCALLLALYWLWLLRMSRAGSGAKSPTIALLGSGAAALLGTQILLNVAGVTKALPMTGITLPLISQGGTSLLAVLLLLILPTTASKAD